jgi:vitamin B12 transporter
LIGFTSRAMVNVFSTTGALDYRISPELSFKASAYTLAQKADTPLRSLADLSLIKEDIYDEQTVGGNLKLVYANGVHSAVLGADLSNGVLDQTMTAGGVSAFTNPRMHKWALFTNDTISLGKLALTPGVRLDHNNVSGSFVSPSLGATYELGEHVIARSSVARGFTSPPLGYSMGGGLRLLPNPALTAESGWSYQAGVESALMDYLNLKANLFRHDTRKELVAVPFDGSNIFRNMGSVVRQGYELEAESAPVYNVSLKGAHAFAHIDADSQPEPTVNYSYQIAIKYDDRQSILAQLAGTYLWWDLPAGPTPSLNARYKTFIWDLNLSKKFHTSETTSLDAFLNVHNLFSGSQYTVFAYPNPGRWVEGGLRINF